MSLDGTARAIKPVLQPADVQAMQDVVKMIYIDDQVKQYILNLVRSTRDPAAFGMKTLKPLIEYGASPRASIYLGLGARAMAFLQAAATSPRRTSRTSPTTCSATASSSPTRPKPNK